MNLYPRRLPTPILLQIRIRTFRAVKFQVSERGQHRVQTDYLHKVQRIMCLLRRKVCPPRPRYPQRDPCLAFSTGSRYTRLTLESASPSTTSSHTGVHIQFVGLVGSFVADIREEYFARCSRAKQLKLAPMQNRKIWREFHQIYLL